MAKVKTSYVCSQCGYETSKWNGKCPNCGEWHVYHTVCGACGYYRGKLAIEKEAAV